MRALFLFLICFVTVSDAVVAAPGVGGYAELGKAMQIKPSKNLPKVPKKTGCGLNQITVTMLQSASDNEFLYENIETFKSVPKTIGTYAMDTGKVWECDNEFCPANTLLYMPAGHVYEGVERDAGRFYVCELGGGDVWEPAEEQVNVCTEEERQNKHAIKQRMTNGKTYLIIKLDVTKTPNKRVCVLEGTEAATTAPVAAVCVKNTIRQVGCEDILNADKCTETCVDGMEWKFVSLDSCQKGWRVVDGNKCVQDKKVGDVCPQKEWPQYATEGKWNSSGTCYATKCNDDALLVVDANGKSQGRCVAKTYCQSQKNLGDEYKLKVINGTKTDLTCERLKQEGGEESKENKECDPKDLPDGATKGTYDKDGMCHATECAEWKKKSYDMKRMTCTDVSQCETSVFVKAGLDNKVTDDMFLDGENVENAEKYLVSDEYCFVYKCKDGFKFQENKCVAVENNAPQGQGTGGDSNDGNNSGGNDANGKDANGKDANGAPATKKTPVDGTVCTPTVADKNVKAWHYKSGVCVPRDCIDGFEVKNDKCTEIAGDCETLPENAVRARRKWDAKQKKILCLVDECKSKYVPADDGLKCIQDIEKLTQERDEARAREQSTANKLIGAAGIGAGGIGGMMLASGMAEQNADADAETAMRAYLATFTCNYGAGKNVAGGTENVELPGGNELIGLYTEYVTLANDLKRRKEDLGMTPGIESEPILESATSGLYDDVATGKTSGAYASLARALMDPEGEDAKAWAAQKEESAKNVKTGAITAGVGAGGSLIGNMIVNRDTYKTPKNDKDKDK